MHSVPCETLGCVSDAFLAPWTGRWWPAEVQKEAYMARLIDDPEFLERVVRERLGYARPDELLFRFADEP